MAEHSKNEDPNTFGKRTKSLVESSQELEKLYRQQESTTTKIERAQGKIEDERKRIGKMMIEEGEKEMHVKISGDVYKLTLSEERADCSRVFMDDTIS